jgi:gliding motility-associated-like protein
VSNHDVCFDTARWCVVVEPDFALWIPNAFTPNGDGYNDEFFCKGENIIKFDMNIFDRWGNKIFTSDNISDKWDGSFAGKQAEQDVYVYLVHAMDNMNQEHKYVGKVTLVR